jgi:hypothetical protein
MENLMELLLERSGNELPPPDAEGRGPFLRWTLYAMLLEGLRVARERQLNHLPCPIRTEIEGWDGRVFMLSSSGEWKEETDDFVRHRVLGPMHLLRELELQKRLRCNP